MPRVGRNAAGVSVPVTLDDIDAILAVNVRAGILATQAALPHMSEGGRIITTGSNLADRVPDAGKALNSTSQSALNVSHTPPAAPTPPQRATTVSGNCVRDT